MFEWLWQEGVLPTLLCIVNYMCIGPSKHIRVKSTRVSHPRWNCRFNRLTICCIYRIFWAVPQHALDRFRLHAIKMKCTLTLEWLRYYFSGNPSWCRKKSTLDCSRREQVYRCKDRKSKHSLHCVSLILPLTAGTIEINVLPIGFPILTKKLVLSHSSPKQNCESMATFLLVMLPLRNFPHGSQKIHKKFGRTMKNVI